MFRYILIFLASAGFAAQAETLPVCSGDSFAPLVYSQKENPAGLLPAVLERASRLSGDRYQLQLYPWKRAYVQAERGDCGILGLSHTAERAKIFDYSAALYDNDIYIVTRSDKVFPYKRLDDLKGKVIGAFNGESFGEDVDKAAAAGLFTLEVDASNESRMLKLLAGRLDAAFIAGGQVGLETVMKTNSKLQENRHQFTVLSVPLVHDPLHLAFQKSMNKKDALQRFDKALATMRRNGELKRLIADVKP